MPPTADLVSTLSAALLPAVLEAARLEMAYFTGGVTIEKKADLSPVTVADREAEAIIVTALGRLVPAIPVVAEEQGAAGANPRHGNRFFLVDALDGTRLFIRQKPEFSINIGLADQGRPVFGMIYVPPTGELFFTGGDGASYAARVYPDDALAQLSSLSRHRLCARAADPKHLVAYNSRSAGGAAAKFLDELGVAEGRPLGSSLKFCRIASGEGDVYARFGQTHEWDTAAGQAILEAAGGAVLTADGLPLTCGRAHDNYTNPHFVAWGRGPLRRGFTPVG